MAMKAVWRIEGTIEEPSSATWSTRSEEHTSELQSHLNLVCRLLLEKKNNIKSEEPTRTCKRVLRVANRKGHTLPIRPCVWPDSCLETLAQPTTRTRENDSFHTTSHD